MTGRDAAVIVAGLLVFVAAFAALLWMMHNALGGGLS